MFTSPAAGLGKMISSGDQGHISCVYSQQILWVLTPKKTQKWEV